ncbi:PREDICTED: endogenous retrovirus group K member 11 Pol protein-like [Pseudopodoces humilis]|uniref:endogenous retrovirus group K member 11 Pol protein-like n=1 Tax=Pseudopodoces humilis TaxID=181119 RepID=UPI0006B7A28C|nr:PREDICTED: endogenous retrovirus group K member 11 Pol protein-like [Pseudopodoces humilis]
MGGADWDTFLMGATVAKGTQLPTLPLQWLVTTPIWENRWPLAKEKLVALRELVQEQLQQGHIEPSTSPWNSPVFVVRKKSGKWRLLQDLRKINAVMESMGALQPGMPSPTMLPMGWKILILDLKDCFFTIPLQPDDKCKSAFTVPTINNAEPVQRYQWKVLPQGCKNSPTICQWYVAQALSGVREQFPEAYCYHYMDDILVAASTQDELLRIQPLLFRALHSYGLQVAPEKVQQHPPWKYLGVKILDGTICHQEVQFMDSIKTLNDAQKLMGIITWLRPYLGLTTAQLSPLFSLLKGDPDLNSPRELTPEAQQALEDVQQAVSARQVYRVDPSIDITVFITCPEFHPTGIIGQWSEQWSDPLHILEWIFLPHQPKKTAPTLFELVAQLIFKCRQRCLQLMAADPGKIVLPIRWEEFEWSLTNSASLQSTLQNFSGQVAYHLPSHKLLQLAGSAELSFRQKSSRVSVQGPTIFTDGSGRTGKAIVTWKDESEWQVLEGHESGSTQLVELRAATMAFQRFSQVPLNLDTDSTYVADLAKRLDCVLLKEVDNERLFRLLKSLWCVIQAQVHPYYILHIQNHTNLPGFIAEGNARADRLANPTWVAPQPDKIAQAKASHHFFHQSAHTLQKQFHLTPTEARDIVSSCAVMDLLHLCQQG